MFRVRVVKVFADNGRVVQNHGLGVVVIGRDVDQKGDFGTGGDEGEEVPDFGGRGADRVSSKREVLFGEDYFDLNQLGL